MSTTTFRPNAAGDETNLGHQFPITGAHWDKVDEVTQDEGLTYVLEDEPNYTRDLYNLPAHTTEAGVINYIKVYMRCSGQVVEDGDPIVYYYGYAKLGMKTGGTVYEDTAVQLTAGGSVSYSKQWTLNPKTGVAWTWDDIDALQIGVSLYHELAGMAYCTQMYVEVNWVQTFTETGIEDVILAVTSERNVYHPKLPGVSLVIGATTFSTERILDIKHTETEDSHTTEVLLNNSDQALDIAALDLKGLDATLSFNTYARAPLKVLSQQLYSDGKGPGGILTCQLSLIGIPNLLNEDKANCEFKNQAGDTNHVKEWLTAVLNGSGGSTMEFTEEQIDAAPQATLGSAKTYRGIGQKFTGLTRTITKIAFELEKFLAPTGNITYTIRKVSDNSLLTSVILGDASILTTSYAWYEATLASPYTVVDDEVYIACEYNSGDATNYVMAHYISANVKSDENLMLYPVATSWEDYPNSDAQYRYKYTAVLAPFNHCTDYDVDYDEEDALIDTYQPKDSFKIEQGESRLGVCQRLLQYTGCEMRAENDGDIHIFVPHTSAYQPDYTYSLENNHPFFNKSLLEGLIIPNKVVVKSRTGDDPSYSGTATSAASYALLPIPSAPVETLLSSDAQALLIATAMISKLEVAKQVGSAEIPLIAGDANCQVFDRIKVTDTRENDSKEGNLGSLTIHYQPTLFNLAFSFGKVSQKGIPGTIGTMRMAGSLGGPGPGMGRLEASVTWAELNEAFVAVDANFTTLFVGVNALIRFIDIHGSRLDTLEDRVDRAFELIEDLYNYLGI